MYTLTIMSALQQMLLVTMVAVCIITLPTLIVGVIISILQAATQINEMTITFIPKLIVMFLVVIALMPWLLEKLVHMTQQLMINLPNYIR
jgi:flagellar biosynthesis protein FliQ